MSLCINSSKSSGSLGVLFNWHCRGKLSVRSFRASGYYRISITHAGMLHKMVLPFFKHQMITRLPFSILMLETFISLGYLLWRWGGFFFFFYWNRSKKQRKVMMQHLYILATFPLLKRRVWLKDEAKTKIFVHPCLED